MDYGHHLCELNLATTPPGGVEQTGRGVVDQTGCRSWNVPVLVRRVLLLGGLVQLKSQRQDVAEPPLLADCLLHCFIIEANQLDRLFSFQEAGLLPIRYRPVSLHSERQDCLVIHVADSILGCGGTAAAALIGLLRIGRLQDAKNLRRPPPIESCGQMHQVQDTSEQANPFQSETHQSPSRPSCPDIALA